jgi:hypothetical protein
MAKRVVLGKYGSGSNDYGLRVSKDGEDVVALQGDGTLDTAVATSDLIFDSSTATGGFGLYKVFSIDVAAAAANTSSQLAGTGYSPTPGSTTQAFGETLSFTPVAICQKVISSTEQETVFLCRTAGSISAYVPPAHRAAATSAGRSINANGYMSSEGPVDRGFSWETSTTNIIIKNYDTSAITVRAAVFYAPVP